MKSFRQLLRIDARRLCFTVAALVLIALLGAGCGNASSPRGQYQRSVALPFEFDDLVQELRKSQHEIIVGDKLSYPMFSAPGNIVLLDDERIEVYAYRNERSANLAAATVSPAIG